MKILFILLALLADIPSGYYDSYCSKETIDSVYTASLAETSEEYGADAEAAAWYYMADWAYNVSLMDLSEHCISIALDSDVADQPSQGESAQTEPYAREGRGISFCRPSRLPYRR